MSVDTSSNIDYGTYADSSSRATWTTVTLSEANEGGNHGNVSIGYGTVNSTGTTTPSVSWPNSHGSRILGCAEFSGVATSTPQDGAVAGTPVGSASANGVSSGTFTTAVNGDLIFGATADTQASTTWTAGTISETFTKILSIDLLSIEYAVQATASASTQAAWTYTAAHSNATGAIALKAAVGGGTPAPVKRPLIF